ncbi:hypothetical protein B8V81_3392 [Paenibacillus pasadenensis]|uniref:Uncharacterized protein n=1 Tax=Paenibacillus pasadenensis TaxID=217090 RepID=A0A2N5N3P5_9BACL|nr:hypothetical protein B8V81_3392 [Paenibacillus pasadenensis]
MEQNAGVLGQGLIRPLEQILEVDISLTFLSEKGHLFQK